MKLNITEKHNELLEEYQSEFESYSDYEVKLLVDDTIQDCNGSTYQNICITVTDTNSELKFIVLIDENYNCFYNVYEDIIEELVSPRDLWKYMYFEAAATVAKLN